MAAARAGCEGAARTRRLHAARAHAQRAAGPLGACACACACPCVRGRAPTWSSFGKQREAGDGAGIPIARGNVGRRFPGRARGGRAGLPRKRAKTDGKRGVEGACSISCVSLRNHASAGFRRRRLLSRGGCPGPVRSLGGRLPLDLPRRGMPAPSVSRAPRCCRTLGRGPRCALPRRGRRYPARWRRKARARGAVPGRATADRAGRSCSDVRVAASPLNLRAREPQARRDAQVRSPGGRADSAAPRGPLTIHPKALAACSGISLLP